MPHSQNGIGPFRFNLVRPYVLILVIVLPASQKSFYTDLSLIHLCVMVLAKFILLEFDRQQTFVNVFLAYMAGNANYFNNLSRKIICSGRHITPINGMQKQV